MDRRDILRAITLTPLAVSLERPSAAMLEERGLELRPRDVNADMEIWHEAGSRKMFRLRLHRKPWPDVGQRISFAFKSVSFVGIVGKTRLTSLRGSDLWVMDVEGVVDEFSARDVSGRD